MTHTDCGTRVTSEWMPQALANGMEWSNLRAGHADRFYNLYRPRRRPAEHLLWLLGAWLVLVYRPRWLRARRELAGK